MDRPKVLIVDDDDNNRGVLCDALGGEPYSLLPAVDGQQALDIADKELPDLILLDVLMPGMDGLAALHQLKAQEKTRHIPVIMVTALNMDSQISLCLDAGAIDHIIKPFSGLVVRARVRAALCNRAAEETVIFTNVLLSAQQEASSDGILAVDGDGKVILANRRLGEMWNIPPELIASESDEILLRSVQGLFVDPDAFLEKVSYLYDHCHETSRDEVALIDGRIFDRYSAPMFGPNDRYFGRVWYFRDITEHKRAEEQLRNYAAELEAANESLEKSNRLAEAANRAKREFLANMSHEIRTPMTAILGFSDLAASPNVPYQERREFLAGIQRNGKALLELIGDILDLSRIEADRLTLERADCPLRQIIDDLLPVVQFQAEQKGLALELDYAFPLPETIHTDPVRLRQVLTNLIGNAVKFTERGAVRITVRCTRETDGPGRMQFAISDTGIGIPADKIGELFDPFTQVDASASRRYGGTGLGLAISKRLAKALGGGVEVTSQLGEGSTFTLTIDVGPLNGVRMLQSSHASPTAEKELPSVEHEVPMHGRVLLAEDVPDAYVVLRRILQGMNLEVQVAENGRLACEMAEKSQAEGKPYDLILMDIQMPRMNGYEASRWLRQHGWKGPIVALTAHVLVADREKCLEAGCDDYIAKPFQNRAVLEMVARHITARKEDQPLVPDSAQPSVAGGPAHNDPPDSSIGESKASTTVLPTFLEQLKPEKPPK